jgi:hypothetical protein
VERDAGRALVVTFQTLLSPPPRLMSATLRRTVLGAHINEAHVPLCFQTLRDDLPGNHLAIYSFEQRLIRELGHVTAVAMPYIAVGKATTVVLTTAMADLRRMIPLP